MKPKNILFLCQSYNRFEKDQIDLISEHFTAASVLIRYNPFVNLAASMNFPLFSNFQLSSLINLNRKPENVNLYPSPVYYLPLDSQYKNLGEKHFKVVDKIIKEKNIMFDLIHSHYTWTSGYVGAKIKDKYNVPFVLTAHGFDVYNLPFKDEEWKNKIELVINSADHVITVSNSNLKCINKLDVDTPVTVIPNGYREDIFYKRDIQVCRHKLNLPLSKKIILSVGNLAAVKGHTFLIDAIKEITKERKDVLCVIVGDGELRNKLKKQIINLELHDYVLLIGKKPHEEIPLWINACDIFVLPSLNEGNPTVMFECLGCGKPFIGTTVGGIPEIISSDDYGLLCEPGNPKELSRTIHEGLDKKWDKKLIIDYSTKFTWSKISQQIVDVYKKIGFDFRE